MSALKVSINIEYIVIEKVAVGFEDGRIMISAEEALQLIHEVSGALRRIVESDEEEPRTAGFINHNALGFASDEPPEPVVSAREVF